LTFEAGDEGDDNKTGMGLINIPAALSLMPANIEPHLYIKAITYTRPSPGSTAEIVVSVRNSGLPVANVSLDMVSLDDRLHTDTDMFYFGGFNMNEIKDNAERPFLAIVGEDVRIGERLPVEWRFEGGGYSRTVRGAIAVGPPSDLDVFTHDVGNVVFSISSFGEYGLAPGGNVSRLGTEGFLHLPTSPTQSLFEMGFLVGNGPDFVSDAVRQIGDIPDNDFLADASGNLRVEQPGLYADQQTFAGFSDALAENPLGLFIEQRTYAWADTTDDDYIILEYIIHNRSDEELTGVRAALFADWDFPWGENQASSDNGRFDSAATVGWMMHRRESDGLFRGIAALTPDGMISYRYIANANEIYDGFTEDEKWEFMTAGFTTTSGYITTDGSHMMTIGEFDLQPGDSAVAAFAVIGAQSRESTILYANRAREKYECILGLSSESALAAEPGSLAFMAQTGGELPESQELSIINLYGTVAWALTHTQSWLSVDPASGSTPDTVTVSVTDIGFAAGNYYDTLEITTADESDTVLVPVTLQIVEGLPRLRVEPDSVHITITSHEYYDGPTGEMPTVWIYNDGHGEMPWVVSHELDFLTIDPLSGTIDAADSTQVELSIAEGIFAPGNYQEFIVVDASTAHDSPDTVVVLLAVVSAALGNSPNPFNPYEEETTISLAIIGRAEVEAKIYDLTGNLVRVLIMAWKNTGETLVWDGRIDDGPVAADGVYLCHLKITSIDGKVREHVLKIAVAK
jgi:hypothetical protein